MTFMTKRLGLSLLVLGLLSSTLIWPLARAQTAAPAAVDIQQPLATADQLKLKAFEALKEGKFEQTNNYLTQAASLSKDPALVKMAAWTRQFEEQRQVFAAERRQEYDKAVSQVQLLQSKHKAPFAVEIAAKAYLLAEDKEAFRKEPWLVQLLDEVKKLAIDFDKNEQWVRALRIYAQLGAIEPESAEWKEKLRTATRRLRLLAMYTPDELKTIQQSDSKERDEVEALLNPTTRPTTKPAQEDEQEQQARVDWRETLKDVRMTMLEDALLRAKGDYFRNVTYRQLMIGGLKSLHTVLTTPALEQAFPGLRDRAKKAEFLGMIDASLAKLQAAKGREHDSDQALVTLLKNLRTVNMETVTLPEPVLVSEFADGAFGSLDPFTSVIWPSELKEFQKNTNGEFSGVGIQIEADESGYLKVATPLEDSPAYHAGVKPGSLVIKINGKSARWVGLTQAVKLITGPPKTKVTLTIKEPDGGERDFVLQRDTIKVASVKGYLRQPGGTWDYFIDPDQKIGYLRLSSFTRTSADDLLAALNQMNAAGVRGIIMDLRNNPGGLLNVATEIVDDFVASGLIVATRPDRPDSPNQEVSINAHATRDEIKTPMIVLVNQLSASASEIVSGALKDHKRALIVGERTFGKGSVQMLFPLGDRMPPEAYLKLTTSHYYLKNGECIHREENSKTWGVEPDVLVDMTPTQMTSALLTRQALDVLRDPNDPAPKPAASPSEKDKYIKKDPLSSDPQLSAALLLMRLQLAGAKL